MKTTWHVSQEERDKQEVNYIIDLKACAVLRKRQKYLQRLLSQGCTVSLQDKHLKNTKGILEVKVGVLKKRWQIKAYM